jgi:HK97 gp10 family phage protein
VRSFDSPGQFAAFLGGVITAMPEAEKRGLEAAAKLIEAEAKAEIGHDEMAAAGPFAAWAPLAQKTIEEKEYLGYVDRISLNDSLYRTGALRDSISHKVGDREAVVGSNSMIAVYQEFGTEHIPPRSFLGGAAVRKGKEAASLIGRAIDATLTGRNS